MISKAFGRLLSLLTLALVLGAHPKAFALMTINISGPETVNVGETVDLSVTVSGEIGDVSYTWSYESQTTGQAGSGYGERLSLPASEDEGSFRVYVTARDSKGYFASDTHYVRVVLPWYLSKLIYNYDHYLQSNPELGPLSRARARMHWKTYGIYEGRRAHPLYDGHEYFAIYPDLANALGRDLSRLARHYVAFGHAEGRIGRLVLSPRVYSDHDYKAFHPALQYLTSEQLRTRWVTVGLAAGEKASVRFRTSEYLAMYPEIRPITGTNRNKIAEYFVTTGYDKKHVGTAVLHPEVFNLSYYRKRHPTLPTNNDAIRHWALHGVIAGLQADPTFSVRRYLAKYPNLKTKFGTNYRAAILHYVTKGIPAGLTSH